MTRKNGKYHPPDPYAAERAQFEQMQRLRAEKPYDPKDMEPKAPLGCVIMGLAFAAAVFWAIVYLVMRNVI